MGPDSFIPGIRIVPPTGDGEGPRYASFLSGTPVGVEARIIRVETHISPTISQFTVVGLPDSVVRESRERVYAAIKSSGFRFPPWRITVNLAPAEVRKAGSALDLPIAIGILAAAGEAELPRGSDLLFLGELGLDGRLLGVHGTLPVTVAARGAGLRGLVVPVENAREAALVAGVTILPCSTLRQAVGILRGEIEPSLPVVAAHPAGGADRTGPSSRTVGGDARAAAFPGAGSGKSEEPDFSDVRGQEHAKRALEVAAAGGHNLLMTGPPGSGKTMLARRLPTILPELTDEEAIEATTIHSVAGLLPPGAGLLRSRPFRAPHHTASAAALAGGGGIPRPGEITLAHHGVLFLDELPEFRRDALELLRQPLESGEIVIARTRLTVRFPASFMLVCAMNPCPCGRRNDGDGRCVCLPSVLRSYDGRISAPLLDRIDIRVDLRAVGVGELRLRRSGESSTVIRARVAEARRRQLERFGTGPGGHTNAVMNVAAVRRYCLLDSTGTAFLGEVTDQLGLSARGYDRVLRVARTIADLEGSHVIRMPHLAEATQWRVTEAGRDHSSLAEGLLPRKDTRRGEDSVETAAVGGS